MSHQIAVIEGDGIGQEVIPAAIDVLEALELGFEFVEGEAGDAVKADTGEALPQSTYDLAAGSDATLFGAAGKTAADVCVLICGQELRVHRIERNETVIERLIENRVAAAGK